VQGLFPKPYAVDGVVDRICEVLKDRMSGPGDQAGPTCRLRRSPTLPPESAKVPSVFAPGDDSPGR